VLTGRDEPVPLNDGTEVRRIERRAIQGRPAADHNPVLGTGSDRVSVTTEGAPDRRRDRDSGDFRDPGWPELVPRPADVAVSLQALHELRHFGRAPRFYGQLRSVLRPNGLVLVCDHLRPGGDERALFMSVDEHLVALAAGGLKDAKLVVGADGMAMFSATNPAP
jgi:hypothetical protein